MADNQRLTKDEQTVKKTMITKNQLGKLKTSLLLKKMANGSKGSLETTLVFKEFYSRYSQGLWNILKEYLIADGYILNYYSENDLLEMVFSEMYLQAATFERVAKKHAQADENACVLAWLGGIAERLFARMYDDLGSKTIENHCDRSDLQFHLDYLQELPLSEEERTEEERLLQLSDEQLKLRKELFDKVFKTLKPVEQQLLRKFYMNNNGRKIHTKEQIDYICRLLKLTRDNLYQTKRRAHLKITRFIEQHEKRQQDEFIKNDEYPGEGQAT